MYERFTDPARAAMKLANAEAKRFHHEYVGTEHILLGLLKDGSGNAARVLDELEVDFRQVRQTVENLVQTGPDPFDVSRLPQTPHARMAIENAREEARKMDQGFIDTGHMLLGLVRVENGLGGKVLSRLGVKLDQLRKRLSRQTQREPITESRPRGDRGTFVATALAGAAAVAAAAGLAAWVLAP